MYLRSGLQLKPFTIQRLQQNTLHDTSNKASCALFSPVLKTWSSRRSILIDKLKTEKQVVSDSRKHAEPLYFLEIFSNNRKLLFPCYLLFSTVSIQRAIRPQRNVCISLLQSQEAIAFHVTRNQLTPTALNEYCSRYQVHINFEFQAPWDIAVRASETTRHPDSEVIAHIFQKVLMYCPCQLTQLLPNRGFPWKTAPEPQRWWRRGLGLLPCKPHSLQILISDCNISYDT